MKQIIDNISAFFGQNQWALTLVKVLSIIIITHLVVLLSQRIWNRRKNDDHFLFRHFLYKIVHSAIYIIGILLAIGQIPYLSEVASTILVGSGILTLAISLSAQESLNNIISGLFITLFRPFEVGDRVTLISSSITGIVEDITLRHTIIKTFTNTRIVVPNSTMNKEIVENSNLIDSRASAFVDVIVAYESDIDNAIKIMADVIGNHPLYLDIRTEEQKKTVPKVSVFVRDLNERGVALRANMWTRTVNENFQACSDARLLIKKSFDAAGIEIPYTKYTILQQDERSCDIHSIEVTK